MAASAKILIVKNQIFANNTVTTKNMPFKNHKRKQIEKKFNSIENPKSETGKGKIIKK